MEEVKVKAPATSANLGSGFDICGLALKEPYDIVTVRKSPQMQIQNTGKYNANNSLESSMIMEVVKKMKEDFGIKDNLSISIDKNIKPKAGMGSSAAESSGTALAINELYSLNLSKEKLVHYASFGEHLASGARHLDNLSPCIFGGFTITYSNEPIKVKKLAPPKELDCLLIIPDTEKQSTKFARSLLPEMVSRKDALYNSFCLAKLITGFMDGNADLILDSMDDKIVEPPRAKAGIFLNLPELRQIGKELGYGIAGSGAGPAILAIGMKNNKNKVQFTEKINSLFKKIHKDVELIWTEPDLGGARVC
ncbi:homoserine kinase [Candidatus Micrarchaeota archaeon]|nr:homoserine kinase [Candidatus Micrarchaeota archaeon]